MREDRREERKEHEKRRCRAPRRRHHPCRSVLLDGSRQRRIDEVGSAHLVYAGGSALVGEGDGLGAVGRGALVDAHGQGGAGAAGGGGAGRVGGVERQEVQVRVGGRGAVGDGVGEAVPRRVRVHQARRVAHRPVRQHPHVRLHHHRVLLLEVLGAVRLRHQAVRQLPQVLGAEVRVGLARRVQHLRYAD